MDQLNKLTKKQLIEKIISLKNKSEVFEESEAKFRSLITSMDDLVFVFDKQKRFIYFHASESQELYAKPVDFLGKKNSEILPAYQNDLFEKAFADTKKGKPHRFEYSLEMKGEIKWYSMQLSPMYKDSEFSGALAVVRNITEQKRNYDALQTYRKHLEDIVKIGESASSSLQLNTVLDNILKGTTKSINASVGMIFLKNAENHLYFAASLGLSDQFVKSYENVLIKPGEGLSGRISENGKPIFIKENSSNDPRIARKVVTDEKLNSFYGVPIMAETEIIGVMNILTRPPVVLEEDDFKLIEAVCIKVGLSIKNAQLYEQLKKSESELKKAYEKAMESDRLKSAFLATMSHELRTPLNAIIGFSDLLKEKLPLEITLKYANLVNNSGRHLLDIVEDLFDVTLLEIGQTNLNRGHYSLDSILETVNAIIDSEKNKIKSDIQIKYNPEVKKDITIYTDKSKLKQILVNLLKNAVKFTSEGYIEYGYRKILKEGISLLQFYVKDTGIGITKEKQKFIFEIFRQADETLTRHYGGTGIGLFIVKKFVEILGGNVNLESELRKGSTFYFTIPYMEEEITEQTVDKISTDKEIDVKNKSVLIVEDDQLSAELLSTLLNKYNLVFFTAKNGNEAVKICSENTNISLVLMDMKMPNLDGYEATKLIKKKRSDIVVVAQTAHAMRGDREKALKAGCDDYITKPIQNDDITRIIQSYLMD